MIIGDKLTFRISIFNNEDEDIEVTLINESSDSFELDLSEETIIVPANESVVEEIKV